MKVDDDTAVRLSEVDALVARANEIALSIRQDLISQRELSSIAQQDRRSIDGANVEPSSEDFRVRALLERKLEERSREIVTLTALVRDLEAVSEDNAEQLKWFGRILLVALRSPTKWGIMPVSWHIRRERRRLAKEGIFDGSDYLRRYPDVARAKIDPLLHYIEHGLSEGRKL